MILLFRPDFGVGSLANVLDMVRVMQFALSEGKVAVHCHAGLGMCRHSDTNPSQSLL